MAKINPVNATYKRYDGEEWITYHFATNAAQVSQTIGTGFRKFVSASVKVNGVAFAEDSNNNAYVTINASNINWYGGTKPTTNYLGSASNIQAALVALDTAAKNAYDNIPSGILTTSNFDEAYPAVDSIEGYAANTDNHGLLRLSNGEITLDATSYLTASTGVTSVAGHVGSVSAAQLKSDLGLGAAAYKGVASSISSSDTGLATAQQVYNAIDALPEPMVFKGSLGTGGTITSLPTAAAGNEGWTYKVITAGTYASKSAKVGDTFICAKTGTNTYEWTLIPSGDEPSGTVTSVGISVPTGLSVSNTPITSSGTIAITFASGYSIPTTAKQTAWDAKYKKPEGGIPDGDLAVKYIPLAGTTALGGSIVPSTTNAVDLGSSSKAFKSVHTRQINADESALLIASEAAVTIEGTSLRLAKEGTSGDAIFTHANTADRTYTLPNDTGTFALTKQLLNIFTGTTTPTGMKTGDLWFDGATAN